MRFPKALAAALMAAAFLLLLAPRAEGQALDAAPPAKLSIWVVEFAGAAPSFYPVGDENKSGMGAVLKGFRRRPASRWSTPPQVDALVLYFSREGESVRVSVHVVAEKEPLAEDTKVAECVLAGGQVCSPSELLSYGVEPVRIGIVGRSRAGLVPPRVENRTRAIEVTSVEVREKGPTFVLALRNASDKSVRAVDIREMRGRQQKGRPTLFDWKGTPLIKPDESWKVTIEFGWNLKLKPDGHAVEPPDRIVISAVLFSDGTYEGSPAFAAEAEAFRAGRRTQMERVLSVVREGVASPGPDVRETLRAVAARVALLECVADWGAVVEMGGKFPPYSSNLDAIKGYVEAGMEWQRGEVLRHLKLLTDSMRPGVGYDNPGEGVKILLNPYEKWLAGI